MFPAFTVPQPQPGNKTVTFSPGISVQPGDVILSSGPSIGAHVVIKAHILPAVAYIPLQSNDLVHWSIGPQ